MVLIYYWYEGKLDTPLWKSLWRLLKKLKLELLHDPATPLLSTYQKFLNQHTTGMSAHPYLITVSLTLATYRTSRLQLKQDRENVMHVSNELLFSHKAEWKHGAIGEMSRTETVMSTKISQTPKDRCHIFFHMKNLNLNLHKQVQRHAHRDTWWERRRNYGENCGKN